MKKSEEFLKKLSKIRADKKKKLNQSEKLKGYFF